MTQLMENCYPQMLSGAAPVWCYRLWFCVRLHWDGEFHPAAENRTLGEVPARAAQRTNISLALLASAAQWTGPGTRWTAKAWEDS